MLFFLIVKNKQHVQVYVNEHEKVDNLEGDIDPIEKVVLSVL